MPKSTHRRKGRTRPRATRSAVHGTKSRHPGCGICDALAVDDHAEAMRLMNEVPGPDSDRHRVVMVGHPDGTEEVQLLAHGQTWVMLADGLDADTRCPECDVRVLDPT